MRDFGLKKDSVLNLSLTTQWDISGRPTEMPRMAPEHKLFAGYDQGFGEKLIYCETLEEMQRLWDAYYAGGAVFPPKWYSGPVIFAEAD
jgi:hypothetical protein